LVGLLARNQFVKHNLVGSARRFGVGIVDLELRRRDLGVIFLIGKAHGALHLGYRVDEATQRIARQRVVVAALIHKLELAKGAIGALGIAAAEQEALDFISGIAG